MRRPPSPSHQGRLELVGREVADAQRLPERDAAELRHARKLPHAAHGGADRRCIGPVEAGLGGAQEGVGPLGGLLGEVGVIVGVRGVGGQLGLGGFAGGRCARIARGAARGGARGALGLAALLPGQARRGEE